MGDDGFLTGAVTPDDDEREVPPMLSAADLDTLAAMAADLDPGPDVLGVDDVPDPTRDRPPPGPTDDDGPQDVEVI